MINTINDIFSASKRMRIYQFIGIFILMLYCFSCRAATSCYLLKNATYSVPSYTASIMVSDSRTDVQLGNEIILEENPNELASSCKSQDAGTNLNFVSGIGDDKFIGTVNDIPVLGTNVKGIGYAIGLRCMSRSSDGCDDYKNQTLWVGQQKTWVTHRAWYPYDSTATMYWQVVLRIYQLSNYQFLGTQIASNDNTQFSTGARLQIGSVYQPMGNIKIGAVFLTLFGNYPTCMSTTSRGGNTINLGDYSISELRNNSSTRRVPFIIDFNQCSNMKSITTKLTSNYVRSGTTLLSNKNRDLGVGLEISTPNNIPLLPNNINSSYIDNDPYSWDHQTMTLYAALKATGQSTVTAGSFETGATLTFTYQ
ncbi:hypothetical protein EYY94_01435 [Obesumbacterium proteus]|uniref:fimbrial protein n=1 Tax=Obesumbacterium proteus TaxID=82983 RepID=UPI00103401B5|nr:fimbrial protein [Obesumbacterium proteus]TBL78898.1 hypothetical protein EYY94_01435 [Obesumbacterium proteus]